MIAVRQDVLAQAQDLAELDVGRAEDLQPAAQLHRERQVAQLARRGTAAPARALSRWRRRRPETPPRAATRLAPRVPPPARTSPPARQPGEMPVGDEGPHDASSGRPRARARSVRAVPARGVHYRLRPYFSWLDTQSSDEIAEAERDLAREHHAGDDLGELVDLAPAEAAEDLQALALRRQAGAAAVGGDDQRRDGDRDVEVAAPASPRCRRSPADDSETLATSWPVAMNMAVMPLGEWAPLLLAPERKAPTLATLRVVVQRSRARPACAGSARRAGSVHSAITRLPRVRMMLTCDAFLSVAKFDSR